MNNFRVKTSAKAVRAALARVPLAVQGTVLAQAAMVGAEYIAEGAQQRAPVRRGILQRNIKARLEVARKTEAEAVVSWRHTRASRNPAFHGWFMEMGTPVRKRKGGGSTGSVAPRPFLRPAYDERYERARAMAQQVLAQQLRQLGG